MPLFDTVFDMATWVGSPHLTGQRYLRSTLRCGKSRQSKDNWYGDIWEKPKKLGTGLCARRTRMELTRMDNTGL